MTALPATPLVDERFLILETLGRGGMAQVFRAFDRLDQRLVALKVQSAVERGGPGHPISAEFDAWCGFLKAHFRVVSLSHLVSRLHAGASLRGLAVITFDDGYRDNFETAAPLLERHELPACFFVASGFIGSDHVPWWDELLPFPLEWMSWDEVRELQRRGFEIG